MQRSVWEEQKNTRNEYTRLGEKNQEGDRGGGKREGGVGDRRRGESETKSRKRCAETGGGFVRSRRIGARLEEGEGRDKGG